LAGEDIVTIYAVASIKGGVGKTTVAENLGVLLAQSKKKVLLIDADLAVSSLTTILGVGERSLTLHDLLAGKGEVRKALCETYGVHLLPSGPTISGFLHTDPSKLREILNKVANDYDYVIIDTPPGVNKYSLTPLKLCDEALIVVNPDVASVDSASKLEALIELLGAKITGIVLNRMRKPSFWRRGKTMKTADIQQKLKTKMIGIIPEDRTVMEAANMRKPVVVYNTKCQASQGFRALAAKIMI
jgi:septum site-determining protein MinD